MTLTALRAFNPATAHDYLKARHVKFRGAMSTNAARPLYATA